VSPLDSAALTGVGPDEALPSPKKDDSGDPDGDFGTTLSTVAAQTPGPAAEATHHGDVTSATDPSTSAPAAAAVATPEPATTKPAPPASSVPPTIRATDPPGSPPPGGRAGVPGPQGATGEGSGPGARLDPAAGLLRGRGPQTAAVAEEDVGPAPPEDEIGVAHPPVSTERAVAAGATATLTPEDPSLVVDERSSPSSGSSAPGDGTSATDSGPSSPPGVTGPLPATAGPTALSAEGHILDPSAQAGSSSSAPASGSHSGGPPGAATTTTSASSGSLAAPDSGGAGTSPSPAVPAAIGNASAPPPAPSPAASGATTAANSSASPQPTPAQQVVTVLAPLQSGLDGTHEVTIGLEPEGLGSVKATITVSAGQVVVQLGAENDQARDALRQALPLLRHELAGDGSSASVLLSGDGRDGRRAQAGDRSTSNDGSDDGPDLDDPASAAVSLPGSLRGHIDLHL
jgi:flagellar hook-length control protein FliK